MAHFQLNDGTRFFVEGSAGEEKIAIHKGKKVALSQWGGADPSGKIMPDLYSAGPSVADLSSFKVTGITQTFVVESKTEGKTILNGRDPSKQDCVYSLTVAAGDFKNHPGLETDLLATKLGQSGDGQKLYGLQRFLHNNEDNLFNQKSDFNVKKFKTTLACGSVAQNSGKTLFGEVSESYHSYHKPLKIVNSRDDVKYEDGTIQRARLAIQRNLKRGVPVRVGTAHHPTTAMLSGSALQPTKGGGHFVLIVGCNAAADTFLYIDPWPGGSTLKYGGGMQKDPYLDKCTFLGLFTLERTSVRGPVIKQDKSTEGSFSGAGFLEVIAGPF